MRAPILIDMLLCFRHLILSIQTSSQIYIFEFITEEAVTKKTSLALTNTIKEFPSYITVLTNVNTNYKFINRDINADQY
jgi:hypothetical protein